MRDAKNESLNQPWKKLPIFWSSKMVSFTPLLSWSTWSLPNVQFPHEYYTKWRTIKEHKKVFKKPFTIATTFCEIIQLPTTCKPKTPTWYKKKHCHKCSTDEKWWLKIWLVINDNHYRFCFLIHRKIWLFLLTEINFLLFNDGKRWINHGFCIGFSTAKKKGFLQVSLFGGHNL